MGIVSRKGLEDEININKYLAGNKYGEAISKGLKMSKITKLNLSSNRLSPRAGY